MDVDFIFKIAAIGIIVTVLNQVLIRSGREDNLSRSCGCAFNGGKCRGRAFYNRKRPVRTLKNGNI